MKSIIFLLLLVSTLKTHAQFFSFQQQWFQNESFFNEYAIREQNIAAIHIWQSEKKDGFAFKHERDFLHYEFNPLGKLTASYKSVVLRKKVDTATFLLSYNQKEQLYKKSEQQGPFHFGYFYFYENERITKEVKINIANKAIDTTYLHYFKYDSTNYSIRKTTLNAQKKPFLYFDQVYSPNGDLIRETKSYHRNQGFNETSYFYKEKQLIKVEKSLNGVKTNEIKISRENEKLELISFFEEEVLVKKYGFTYHQNGLPKAIIERNLVEKKITIYRLEYLYYSN